MKKYYFNIYSLTNMDNVIDIKTKLQLNNTIKMHKGFGIKYNNKKYIITIHCNLPYVKVYDKYDNPLNILINSRWSEVLILEKPSYLSCYCKISNKIPKFDDVVYFYIDGEKQMLNVIDVFNIGFDNIDNRLTIPYIICNFIDEISDESSLMGLSGSPVFQNDKIIGIFSKFNKAKKYLYILPIYIAIKNITKKDNNIYNVNYNIDDIKKVNKFNIIDNIIFHSTMNVNLSLTSYFFLESDIDTQFKITNKTNEKVICDCVLNNKLYLSNEPDILYTDDMKYKLNLRLMTLLNSKLDLEKKKELFTQIFERYQKNDFNKVIYFKF